MKIRIRRLNKSNRKLRRITSKKESVGMGLSLSEIREKNRNPNSVFNSKPKKIYLSKEEYEKGRVFFTQVIEPLGIEALQKLNEYKN